jgi:hypothetical protein
VEASADPDTATAQTIRIMCGHVKNAARDLVVIGMARDARERFARIGNGQSVQAVMPMPLSAEEIAHACWWWPKLYVKFVLHDFIIRERLGEVGHLQGLISPEVLVRMEKPEGDCAIFSECIAAFLSVLGVGYEWVTVAVNPREPEIFSHVYLYAILPDGARLPLDASHGDYPGWQVPSAHVSRRQVWDADGNPVEDQGSRFDGLHGYGLRGGLGVEYDADGFPIDDLSGTTYGDTSGGSYPSDPTFNNPTQVFGDFSDYTYTDPSGATYSGAKYQAPSQSSTAWANFAAQMGKAGMTLAQINAIQPGTVVGANGQILRQSTGYAVPGTTLSSSLGSNSTLIIGLAALAGLMLFMGKK